MNAYVLDYPLTYLDWSVLTTHTKEIIMEYIDCTSFNQIEVYKNKRYNIILQSIEEKIEIDKIKTMNIANYLKSVEVYSKFCNKVK